MDFLTCTDCVNHNYEEVTEVGILFQTVYMEVYNESI